ncbi:MAG: metalloregulator ArsR/SmtB family transcription factor [Clostridia bacterium]
MLQHENIYNETLFSGKNIPTTELSYLFKILSDDTRLKILFVLREGEHCVFHISEKVSMKQSSVSHQLKTLRQYKVVKVRREGRQAFYSLTDEHIFQLLDIGLTHILEE